MEASQIIFILSAILILSSAVLVTTSKNLVHAALWLISTLFGVAILYVLLDAGFLAVVQVVVYIGAIAIMFIFAVMLTRRELLDTSEQINKSWPMAAGVAALLMVALGALLAKWDGLFKLPAPMAEGVDPIQSLGIALTSPDLFVLPFEVASVLLLAALLGAVYVAMDKK